MCVIGEFEDPYKIFVSFNCSLIFSALKLFSKYEQRYLIKIQIARGKNARQNYWKLVVERDFTISYCG